MATVYDLLNADSSEVEEQRVIRAPGATTGDVLTVQANGTIDPAPGGLPPEWTVTDGALKIAPTNTGPNSLEIDAPPNALADDTYLLIVKDENGATLFRLEPDAFLLLQVPTGSHGAGLKITGDDDSVASPGQVQIKPGYSGGDAALILTPPTGRTVTLELDDGAGAPVHVLTSTQAGFFGASPVSQQTGVPVDAAGIHAALVALGLITA